MILIARQGPLYCSLRCRCCKQFARKWCNDIEVSRRSACINFWTMELARAIVKDVEHKTETMYAKQSLVWGLQHRMTAVITTNVEDNVSKFTRFAEDNGRVEMRCYQQSGQHVYGDGGNHRGTYPHPCSLTGMLHGEVKCAIQSVIFKYLIVINLKRCSISNICQILCTFICFFLFAIFRLGDFSVMFCYDWDYPVLKSSHTKLLNIPRFKNYYFGGCEAAAEMGGHSIMRKMCWVKSCLSFF